MIKRWALVFITLILVIVAVPADFSLLAEEDYIIQNIYEDFEDITSTNDFVSQIDDNNDFYLSSNSNVKIIDDSNLVLFGTKSIAVSEGIISWNDIYANDTRVYINISVRIDSAFNNLVNLNFVTLQPSNVGGNKTITAFSIKKDTELNENLLLDGAGNIVGKLEENHRYDFSCEFVKGSQYYNIYEDNILFAEKCDATADIYSIEKINIDTKRQSTNEDMSYIVLDDIKVYSKGKAYPQQFSSQKTGKIPNVEVVNKSKNKEIRIFVNETELSFYNKPIKKEETVYIDLEQFARCVNMELHEEKSRKEFTLSNDKVVVKASVENSTITINGKNYTVSYPPKKFDGVIYVTPHFICEALNAKVWWDDMFNTLVITTGQFKSDNILRVVGNMLYLNGEPYYGFGLNVNNLLDEILNSYDGKEFKTEKINDILKKIKDEGIDTIRVSAVSKKFDDIMYNNDSREKYFAAMDKMFELLKKHDLKVVVSLGLTGDFLLKQEYIENSGWIKGNETFVDIVSNPNCESRQNVYDFIELFITRYKNQEIVLMWEVDNGANNKADVGAITKNVTYSLIQLSDFYTSCANTIKKYDDRHVVSTGDAALLKNQWNLFESTMTGKEYDITKIDTLEERMMALSTLNKSFDVISFQSFGLSLTNEYIYTNSEGNYSKCDFDLFKKEAASLDKAIYNGATYNTLDMDEEGFILDAQAYLNSIIYTGIQLSYWFSLNEEILNVDTIFDNEELINMIAEANATLKEKYIFNKVARENISDAWDNSYFSVIDENTIIDGSEFVAEESLKVKMIHFGILCISISLCVIICVFILTREKIIRKRKDDIVW